jgi:hypothetical protein
VVAPVLTGSRSSEIAYWIGWNWVGLSGDQKSELGFREKMREEERETNNEELELEKCVEDNKCTILLPIPLTGKCDALISGMETKNVENGIQLPANSTKVDT